MRHILSTAIVALVVAGLTAVTVSAVAQSEPESVSPAALSNINAHRVDGKHAVRSSATRVQRAGKLVATNSQGYLPSNILNPRPVTRITLESINENGQLTNAVNTTAFINVDCPDGARLTGGGFQVQGFGDAAPTVQLVRSRPEGEGWEVAIRKVAPDPLAGPPSYGIWAICLTT